MSGNDRFTRQPLWRWDNQWTRKHVHELSLEEGRKTKSGQTSYMKPSRLGTHDELGVGFLFLVIEVCHIPICFTLTSKSSL